ncbi:type I secretion system permease/ATPase [Ancylobacter pratisalsi]|uniref:Type I secretion system permease/ATPase n=1 Tax=Ancylobacter pratisalsi TaxID=1745854 RepID=A0A6P1YK53_9HYPH|nr:type I secretion system permease/ATPase [Ancylobacter pratisalsi]QIB33340.1 type I secretion system permease/ATPase [Ancylobacter pratisalsi]
MKSELAAALKACRTAFLGVGLITFVINILYLTGSLFMLEVYDRVIPSRSVATLVGLCVLALMLYAFQGVLDVIRGRVLGRIGVALDEQLSGRIYGAIVRLPLRARAAGDGLQPARDLDHVRGFLSGLGPTALFDLPWIPFYLALCFLFHPLIGATALIGGLALAAVAFITDRLTGALVMDTVAGLAGRNALTEAGRRNAEVLQAMAMGGRLQAMWGEANRRYVRSQQRANDVIGGFGAASKVFRVALQSAVLAVGAYLVINQQATAGIIIASSILTARALAPVELAIAHWKGFVQARQGWRRLRELLARLPEPSAGMALPKPHQSLVVEALSLMPPGERRVVVQEVSFALKAGQGLGIVGASGSGKTSLVRAIVGAWAPARGLVRLDGAALEQWPHEDRGGHVGYLPQDVELFQGTVAQNIARFHEKPAPADIIAAAQAAGVHDLILRFPEGYETQIGEGGASLSAGQRQRVALARALYGDPFLVVLDEPSSNLDGEGEQALNRAILGVRARGGIAIVVAHRAATLAGVDVVLVMQEGRLRSFGPKDEVLGAALARPPGPPAVTLAAVGERPA